MVTAVALNSQTPLAKDISEICSPASFKLSFFATISSASTRSLFSRSFHFLSFSLFLCPLCNAWSMFPLSTLFLWPRFKFGTQSTLYLSQPFTGLPETKWRLHTQSFTRVFSVKSDWLIAEIQCIPLSKDNFSTSSLWFLTSDGTQAKWRFFPGALSLVQSTTMQNHLHSEDTNRFVYSVTPPIWRHSDGYVGFGQVSENDLHSKNPAVTKNLVSRNLLGKHENL